MQTHTPGGNSDMSTLSEEIVALSISSHSGDDSDPMTDSSGIDAVSLRESSTESETKTPPSSVHEKEPDPVCGHTCPDRVEEDIGLSTGMSTMEINTKPNLNSGMQTPAVHGVGASDGFT